MEAWTAVVPPPGMRSSPWVEWVHATWPGEGEPPRSIWLRVPGKWERRVRVWRRTHRVPWDGGAFTTPGDPVLCVEADDGCPISRGPVTRLCDLVPTYTYLEDTELAGLEWRPL